MNRVSKYILSGFSFIICMHSFGQKSELAKYRSGFENELNGWTKAFKSFDLSSFKKEDNFPFENIEYMDTKDVKEFYAIYKPALAFSPDRNRFIDIYSYWLNLEREGQDIIAPGGEADQAITLCNFKTKKWARILFRGTTERIQDATWVTNTEFILAGFREDSLSRQVPVIYIGNIITGTFTGFISKNNKTILKSSGYNSPKLLKLKIKKK